MVHFDTLAYSSNRIFPLARNLAGWTTQNILFFCQLKSSDHHHHHRHLSHFTSECGKFKQPGRITSFTTEWHRTKINIKISLLQMILYPVALFQQKIVITNKILHLSPKHFLCISCFFFLFLHFKSLSSVRNSFSLLLCNIQLLCIYFFCNYFHNLYNLIQFNASLSTTENRTARSTKWQEGQREYWEQTVQRHHPARLPPTSSRPSAQRAKITVDAWIWPTTCAISATDPEWPRS